MKTERYNEIIEMLIEGLNLDYSICGSLMILVSSKKINSDEYNKLNDQLNYNFDNLRSNGHTYDENGGHDVNGNYRFKNKQERIDFLEQWFE